MSRNRASSQLHSQQQQREFRDYFHLFDKEFDGKIDPQQIGDVCRALGLNPSQDMVQRTVENERRGARITFQEFQRILSIVSKEKEKGSAADFIEGLKMLDTEESGIISVGELRHILTNIGDKLSNTEVDRLLMEMKTDGDMVNYEEFVRRVMSS